MRGTARAHSNMALIKYWGKRDEDLILPANSSLSMTLDALYTTTTVAFQPDLVRDELILNGAPAAEAERRKVESFLNHVRVVAKATQHAIVTSTNHVPTSAGLASSASGFAALAAASAYALELHLDAPSLSRLARRGSGSACRSVYGGFVEWRKGDLASGADSHGVVVASSEHWELNMLIACVANERKAISSREGMRRTIQTSPFYSGWLASAAEDLEVAKQAILARDFSTLGQVVESNAMKMHATTLGARPPFTYWTPSTLAVMRKVEELRESGTSAFFTIDAGPNVAILCETVSTPVIRQVIENMPEVKEVILCKPGPGIAQLTEVTP